MNYLTLLFFLVFAFCCFAGGSLGRGFTLQVWTYRGRVAFVLSVTEKGRPVCDGIKLQRLKQLVTDIMMGDGNVIVDISKVCCPLVGGWELGDKCIKWELGRKASSEAALNC